MMLHYIDLDKLIFEEYPPEADELKVLSGYIGPTPVDRLRSLPMRSTVIHGLFYENQNRKLHEEMLKMDGEKVGIYYPSTLSHSKCYLWLRKGKPLKGLIGSANFSSNGLNNPLRESLYEIDPTFLNEIHDYINTIHSSSRSCRDVEVSDKPVRLVTRDEVTPYQVDLSLVDRLGNVHPRSNLNWGQAKTSNVRPNDAYIAIRTKDVLDHPEIFRPRSAGVSLHNIRFDDNEVIELIWDDGVVMQARFEGTQPIRELGGLKYPKQLASFPKKDILGIYMRRRLGVKDSIPIKKEDLEKLKVKAVSINMIETGVFSATLI